MSNALKIEPRVIASAASRPHDWVMCIHCDRYFRVEHARTDFRGNREGCAFCSCAGLGVAIFPWHVFRSEQSPSEIADLAHGLAARAGRRRGGRHRHLGKGRCHPPR